MSRWQEQVPPFEDGLAYYIVQFVIGRRRHLLVGYRLHYRLHKLNMADLATATFYSLVSFIVLL